MHHGELRFYLYAAIGLVAVLGLIYYLIYHLMKEDPYLVDAVASLLETKLKQQAEIDDTIIKSLRGEVDGLKEERTAFLKLMGKTMLREIILVWFTETKEFRYQAVYYPLSQENHLVRGFLDCVAKTDQARATRYEAILYGKALPGGITADWSKGDWLIIFR